MGDLTLTRMVNSVFARVDENPASDNAVTSRSRPEITRVVESLNMGYRKVFTTLYGSLRPQVLDAITTSSGNPSYDVSPLTDILQTMYVYPLNDPGTLLVQSNVGELTQKFGPLNTLGIPAYWYRFNKTLSLYPVPSAATVYVVEGSVVFTGLSDAQDTTFLPNEHDHLLQTYATAVEKTFWKDPDAGMWKQEFEEGLERLLAEALRNMPTKTYYVDPYSDPTEPQKQQLQRIYT